MLMTSSTTNAGPPPTLARFVAELRRIDPPGRARRARPLRRARRGDARSDRVIAERIDGEAAAGGVGDALQAPAWDGAPVWITPTCSGPTCWSTTADLR